MSKVALGQRSSLSGYWSWQTMKPREGGQDPEWVCTLTELGNKGEEAMLIVYWLGIGFSIFLKLCISQVHLCADYRYISEETSTRNAITYSMSPEIIFSDTSLYISSRVCKISHENLV